MILLNRLSLFAFGFFLVLFFASFVQAGGKIPVERLGAYTSFARDDATAFVASLEISKTEMMEIVFAEPLAGSVFPPDFAPPLVSWLARSKQASDSSPEPGGYVITISSRNRAIVQVLTDENHWIPSESTWAVIQQAALEDDRFFQISVRSIGGWDGRTVTGTEVTTFSISNDPLGADVFFLRKPVPFAVGQAHPEMSQWLRADLSSAKGVVRVMDGVPVCGNCHAFSPQAKLMGMDLDVDGDKGGYVLVSAGEETSVGRDNIISWNDRPVPAPVKYSFGLFTSISPDGRFAASTVGESSIFIRMNDVAFSQLFFPVTGRVGVYDIEGRRHFDLPGADDTRFVQTCPSFSPNMQAVAFARAPVNEAYVRADLGGYTREEPLDSSIFDLNEKYPIQYDIWTVPFNGGEGGQPVPLAGASDNGRSNYFPRYSPDGKWIIFVQAPTGLVLQPGSRLAIVPAAGGEVRELASNVNAMNSWHSWSPNGKWLVFAGKDRRAVTELFLTHIDEAGEASPAVRLFRLSSSTMAAMVPEFIPSSWNIKAIRFAFELDGSRQSKRGNVR
jgi:hypothetical protein